MSPDAAPEPVLTDTELLIKVKEMRKRELEEHKANVAACDQAFAGLQAKYNISQEDVRNMQALIRQYDTEKRLMMVAYFALRGTTGAEVEKLKQKKRGRF